MMQATSPDRTSTTTTTTTPSRAATPKAFSLASGTASPATTTTTAAAGRLHPVASMATTASITGSCSGRSMEEGNASHSSTQLGLALDSTTDEDSHHQEEEEESFRDEQDMTGRASCVDCGAGNTCSCFGGVTSPTRMHKTERAYSIKLGQAKSTMLDERFGRRLQQQQQQHLSSQALTVVAGDLSESPLSNFHNSNSSTNSSSKDYFVKRLAPEASGSDDEGSSGQSLHLQQHKGTHEHGTLTR